MQHVKVRRAFLRRQIPYVLWVYIAGVMFVAVTIYRVAERIGGEQAQPLRESPLQPGYDGVIGRVNERCVISDIADALVGTPRIHGPGAWKRLIEVHIAQKFVRPRDSVTSLSNDD